MVKSELLEKFGEVMNMPPYQAEKVINAIFSSMTGALISGDRIEIRGFGRFSIKEFEGYTGHNPKTGKQVPVKPKKRVFFKAGREIKGRIMSG